ncbi:MAG: hypothetical protein GWO02_21850 [Gammaproteobacteria bacterium]|nr:hypothetical protein [Gammaproteobacteria bacterium]
MGKSTRFDRRRFVQACLSTVALAGCNRSKPPLPEEGYLKRYDRAKLVDRRRRPITAESLQPGETYVFNYPYRATPCFLLDLGKPTETDVDLETEEGQAYRWRGGVGPGRSVVSYSAICSHRLTYPAPSVSFISYRDKPVKFKTRAEEEVRRRDVIYCCSERSVYDPAAGARVLGGPAPQPLAAIVLESDGDGTLYATGAYGGTLFQTFFDKFGFSLELQFVSGRAHDPVREEAEVVPIAEYSDHLIFCG